MMHNTTLTQAQDILSKLIAIPSVNPMGRSYEGHEPVERKAIEFIEELFRPFGLNMVRQSCSDIHESLLIHIAGQFEGPITLLESHIDTVPADGWLDRAFVPSVQGDLLYGCGACDDKGSLVAMILALLDLLSGDTLPYYPVILLAAGDEEYAQSGIKRFIKDEYDIGGAVFGEPTDLMPIIQHKGTVRWGITVNGRSAHSSRPELGINAINGMAKLIEFIQDYQERLQSQYTSRLMTGPTITVTMIEGGRTRNAIPDKCTIAVDFRVLPGMDPATERDRLIAELEQLELNLTHSSVQLMTPPLNTEPDDSFCQQVLRVCCQVVGPETATKAVPYGTDAAWVSAQAPAVVLGPGNVDVAHIADEHVSMTEVIKCAEIYRRILLNDCSPSDEL